MISSDCSVQRFICVMLRVFINIQDDCTELLFLSVVVGVTTYHFNYRVFQKSRPIFNVKRRA